MIATLTQPLDPLALIDSYAPGIVVQREMIDALAAAMLANGGTLTPLQVVAIVGPLPAPVTTIRRMPPQ